MKWLWSGPVRPDEQHRHLGLLRQLHSRRRLRLFIGDESDQLNTGWCTPGVHAPEVTGGNRRQRNTAFTLTIVVHAGLSVVFLRFNSPLAHVNDSPGSSDPGLRMFHARSAGVVAGKPLAVFSCRRCCGGVLLRWVRPFVSVT